MGIRGGELGLAVLMELCGGGHGKTHGALLSVLQLPGIEGSSGQLSSLCAGVSSRIKGKQRIPA